MSSKPSVRPRWLLNALFAALLVGCGAQVASSESAIDVHDGDICAVCGMYLRGSPGPRAQAWETGSTKPLIFDSVRDFFAWELQPEHQHTASTMYVQDSARIDWQHPTGAASSFIDAHQAYYVAWQPLPGSMGATLAPFATRAAAEHFVAEHGGAVLSFDQITPDLVASLTGQCPAPAAAGTAPICHAPPAGAPPAAGGDESTATMSPASMH